MSPCRSVACCSPGAASRPEEASRTSQGSRWTITTPATASAALPPARSLQVGPLRCIAALQIPNLAMTATAQACLLHLLMGNLTSCTVWRAHDSPIAGNTSTGIDRGEGPVYQQDSKRVWRSLFNKA